MKVLLNDEKTLYITDDAGVTLVERVDSEMRYPGPMYDTLYIKRAGDWTLFREGELTVAACENVRLEFKPLGRGLAVRNHFTNTTGKQIEHLSELVLLEGIWKENFVKYVFNRLSGFNGNITNDMRTRVDIWQPLLGQYVDGGDFTAARDSRGQHVILGFASYERYFNEVRISGDGYFNGRQLMESHPFAPGETIVTDWFYMGLCDDFVHGIPEFMEITADFMNIRLRNVAVPVGFCTWYYYLNNISQEIVYENLAFFQEHRAELPIRYFQIDDGWHTGWGDWEPNERFPKGMKQIADDIKAAGFLPGIWVAPFGADKNSRVRREHPDWFVKCWDSDDIWQEESLDMTHPEVQQYIKALFHRLSHEWGYRYIKIDIVIDRAAPGRHYHPKATALMNIREGFRIMKEAVTEDTFLLACTSPLAPLAGLCDSMRVSGDVFESWEAARCLFSSNLNRYFYHNRYFMNDFDALCVRENEEEDAECGRKMIRDREEIKCYLTAIAASGGTLMLSDKMTLLPENKIHLLSTLFPVNTQAAEPLDFTESDIPGILDFGYKGNTRIVALINWNEKGREMRVPVERSYAFEFWSGTYLGAFEDTVSRYIEPRHCEVLFLTREAPMAVVGLNDCLCPCIEQIYEAGILNASFVKKDEVLYVVSKSPVVSAEGCSCELINFGEALLYRIGYMGTMHFTIRGKDAMEYEDKTEQKV